MPEAIICICNSRSGRKPNSYCLPDLTEFVQAQGIQIEHIDLAAGFEDKLAAALARREWRVVAGIGGDGTHLACFNALLNLKKADPKLTIPPYAVIPFGTGNNLAKSLSLSPGRKYLPHAMDVMLNGQDSPMDLGTWDEGWFCDGLAVGLDAEILARRDHLQQRFGDSGIHGYALYALGTLQALPGFRPIGATVTVDGAPWHRGPITNLVVNNCRIYAGEFALTPAALVDDGLLDAVCISHPVKTILSYLGSWRHLHLGGCNRRIRQGTQFTIELDRPASIQVDGELFSPRQRLTIGIDPKAVIVKRQSTD